jgi:hypothetical protein
MLNNGQRLRLNIIDRAKRQHVVFTNSSQLHSKVPRQLGRLSPELVEGSFWPTAGCQEVTPAVWVWLESYEDVMGCVHNVYSKVRDYEVTPAVC